MSSQTQYQLTDNFNFQFQVDTLKSLRVPQKLIITIPKTERQLFEVTRKFNLDSWLDKQQKTLKLTRLQILAQTPFPKISHMTLEGQIFVHFSNPIVY